MLDSDALIGRTICIIEKSERWRHKRGYKAEELHDEGLLALNFVTQGLTRDRQGLVTVQSVKVLALGGYDAK